MTTSYSERRIEMNDRTTPEESKVGETNLANAGKTWHRDEYDGLRKRFDQGMTIAQLAKAHGRTTGAILAKLLAMRLLVETQRGFYHKVDPDPWCNHHDVRQTEVLNAGTN
ncbi:MULTISPECIES: hypothetical protein [Burkholderia]|uniref:hypothetical protein n=1 Tax=Burkholderia TaxID=32008 RepID=UPI0011AF0E91|nr:MULTISPECIES: hypothetical protein [Burkholderia]